MLEIVYVWLLCQLMPLELVIFGVVKYFPLGLWALLTANDDWWVWGREQHWTPDDGGGQ